MPTRSSSTGSEPFIVDNSDVDRDVARYLHDWCQLSRSIDIETGYFEIGSLPALGKEWQKVDHIRILMGDEVSLRTKNAFAEGLRAVTGRLDASVETEKLRNDFLTGVPAIVRGFHVGGYRVCNKWLKDRRSRTLTPEDVEHYQRVVVALHETIRLMAEIDKVIDAHGGRPGAFATAPPPEKSGKHEGASRAAESSPGYREEG